jgi:hypothetical protein
MFGKIARGWQLALLSWDVLRQNRQLLVFPLFSLAAMAVLLASFALPGWPLLAHAMHGSFSHGDRMTGALLAFIFYWVNFTVVAFFNVALVSVTMEALDGQEATVSSGISNAMARLPSIIVYSAVAATVGTVLHAIEERVGWVGQIVAGLIGVAWAVSVALVVPVLAAEEVGPFQAIGRSVELVKNAWGEGLTSGGGIGAITSLVSAGVLIVGGGLAFAAISGGSIALGILLGLITVAAMCVVALVHATLSTINLAVLYRFANGELTAGYDQGVLEGAFVAK